MAHTYSYSTSLDTANGTVNATNLHEEILAGSLGQTVESVSVDSGNSTDLLEIQFDSILTSADKTTLDGIVLAHDGVIEEFVTLYASSDVLSSTTSTTFVNKLTLTTSHLCSGIYRICWSGAIDATVDCSVQIVMDGTEIGVAENYRSSGFFNGIGGFYVTEKISGVIVLEINYKTTSGTAYIKNARLEIGEFK